MAKVIYNKIIPLKGYTAITILPFIFTRVRNLKDYELNHEKIHLRQQLEVLLLSVAVIGVLVLTTGLSPWWLLSSPAVYYTMYCLEWLLRLVARRNRDKAYKGIAVEQEAYCHQYDMGYLSGRKPFSWVPMLIKEWK